MCEGGLGLPELLLIAVLFGVLLLVPVIVIPLAVYWMRRDASQRGDR